MKLVRLGISLVLLIVLLSIGGCNTSGCLENRNSVPLAGFYSSRDQAKLLLDSVQIIGEGMTEDDPLSAAGTRINSIYLPMRSAKQSTTWIFQYKWKRLDYPELYDTISFHYDSTPYFASSDCGVIYKYQITRMTHTTHLMDSVVMVDSLITNVDIEQIKIYFRTADSDNEEENGSDSEGEEGGIEE